MTTTEEHLTVLRDLSERIDRQHDELASLATDYWQRGDMRYWRWYTGKSEGLRLAKVFVDETIRDLENSR